MSTPPSFQPKSNRPRPGAEGNKGTQKLPPERPPASSGSGRTQTPLGAQPMQRPPSFAPRSRTSHTASGAAAADQTRVQPAPNMHLPAPNQAAAQPKVPRKPRRRSRKLIGVAVVLAILFGWPAFLLVHATSSLHRVDARTGLGPDTPGTTYLFAGSDSREGWAEEVTDDTERSDSAILIHKAPNGQAAMVSIPRDSYVDVPGVGMNKFNAAFAIGGPALMVETVEQLTGMTVDHYVQIGMGGVGQIVDALGGVELCWDADVDDPKSGMDWTAGCHHTDGEQTLAFTRMRYQDPTGDYGRTERQRQVLGAVTKKAMSPSVLLNPVKQFELSGKGANALTVGENTGVLNVAQMMLAMRKATSSGLTGPPPIGVPSAMNEVGSVVILNSDRLPDFFHDMTEGQLTAEDFALNF